MAETLSKCAFDHFRDFSKANSYSHSITPAWIPPALVAWVQNPILDDELGAKILSNIKAFTQVLGYNC